MFAVVLTSPVRLRVLMAAVTLMTCACAVALEMRMETSGLPNVLARYLMRSKATRKMIRARHTRRSMRRAVHRPSRSRRSTLHWSRNWPNAGESNNSRCRNCSLGRRRSIRLGPATCCKSSSGITRSLRQHSVRFANPVVVAARRSVCWLRRRSGWQFDFPLCRNVASGWTACGRDTAASGRRACEILRQTSGDRTDGFLPGTSGLCRWRSA